MKYITKIVSLTLLCLTLYATNVLAKAALINLPQPTSSAQDINQIVAIVNDDVITQTELDQAVKQAKKRIEQSHMTMPDSHTLNTAILNQLIDQKLQLEIAKRAGISVSEKEVSGRIKLITQQNKISLTELKKKLAASNDSYEDFRKQLKDQMTIAKVQQQAVTKTPTVSETEITDFLKNYTAQQQDQKQYHLLDILIPLTDSPTQTQIEQAKTTATSIYNKLKKGGSLKQLPASVTQNSLGWRNFSAIPTLFATQVNSLQKDQMTHPIQAPNGFHIIKLLGTKGQNPQLPSRKQAEQMLMQQKFAKLVQAWLEKLKATAYVHISVPQ